MTTLFMLPTHDTGTLSSAETEEWLDAWRTMAPDRPAALLGRDDYEPEAVRYAIVWQPPRGALAALPRLEAVFNCGAGVDALIADPTLPDVPVVRLVADDLSQRMTEWVALQVMTHHRRALEYLEHQRGGEWRELPQPSARDVRVGLMGYGTLARHAAPVLLALGYRVHGWSRSARSSGVTLHVGARGLDDFLAATDVLVCLLPHTPDTRGLLDADLIAKLSRDSAIGPVLINAGRGAVQVEADVAAALHSGALRGASLDVFATEPLPADSPLWGAPNLIITPHCASISDPRSTVAAILAQIVRVERGEPLEHVVDRARGY
ncbi:2-hydroxyacid dehydrogenase [Acuticoccus sp.]|uniref:2-hydroxyacid dehydrogenase n=1 Tax=Acuticoccus sp. TaxID=1904378 RepID=UPI003B5168DA